MAPTKKDFVWRTVLAAVVLISLSGVTSAGEPRRCYWCGPLAEQVHRSQRAPSCEGPNTHVTVCDNGYTHCAIVATSPPYLESRYCVKLYQDECYSLYCNSTKTWRMTCPCRGDLCNGPNGEREDQAFTYLAKLVTKHGGKFKRAVDPSENGDNLIPTAASSNNNDTEMVANANEPTKDKTETEAQQTQHMETAPNNAMDDKGMQADQPASMNLSENTPKTEEATERNKSKDNVELTTRAAAITEMEKKETTEMITKPTAPVPSEVKKPIKDMKPSEQMPPAEALQHNDTPTKVPEKVPEKITMGTTTLTSTESIITTESPMPRNNNTASQIDKHLFTLAIGIIVLY